MICVDGWIAWNHGARKGVIRVSFGPLFGFEEAFFEDFQVGVFRAMREVARTGEHIPSDAGMARSIAGAIERFDPFRYDDY